MAEKITPSSPQFEEACRASARKYAKRSIRLGLIFHGAQQEAYESWVELDQWADAQEEAYTLTVTRDEAMEAQDEELKRSEEKPTVRHLETSRKKKANQRQKLTQQKERVTRVSIPWAASEEHSASTAEPPQEQLWLIPLKTFEVEGARYEALADSKGQVFLIPSPEFGKTRLVLGEKSYSLERVKNDENLCRVIDLGQGQLTLFFARRRRSHGQRQISFE